MSFSPRVALLLAFLAPDLPSQPPVWPIRSLAVEGNRIYPAERILELTGLKIGQPGDQKTFEQARDRLLATGVFETVGFRFGPAPSRDGYAVVFEVAEIEQVYPIRFEFLEADPAQLRAWLKSAEPLFSDKIPGTKEVIARYAAAIEAYLKQKGRQEKITGELTADKPDELYVMFRPAGALPVVADVDFTGNKVIPAGVLRQAIRGVAIGSRYTEPRFRELLETSIRPLYEARGRLRVAFPKISSERAPGDVSGLKITVQVDEGETYSLGDVKVEGTASMNQELLKVAALKIGDLANFEEVRAAIERVNARLRHEGYLKAATRSERRFDDDKKTVDLVLVVDPGPQYRFGNLRIEGLDVNAEYEIRRIWGLKEGEAFPADYPQFFLDQVRERGIFDNLRETRSRIDVDDAKLTADVTLIFNPPKPNPLPSTFDDPLKRKPR
jgi:outer membrane protein insertion porin family